MQIVTFRSYYCHQPDLDISIFYEAGLTVSWSYLKTQQSKYSREKISWKKFEVLKHVEVLKNVTFNENFSAFKGQT